MLLEVVVVRSSSGSNSQESPNNYPVVIITLPWESLLYFASTSLDFTLLYSTLLYSTLLYFALLYSTCLYSTLPYSTLLLLCSTLLLLCPPLLYFYLPCLPTLEALGPWHRRSPCWPRKGSPPNGPPPGEYSHERLAEPLSRAFPRISSQMAPNLGGSPRAWPMRPSPHCPIPPIKGLLIGWFLPIFTYFSDFLGRLQPSTTTTHKTLNTLGVEESSRRMLV